MKRLSCLLLVIMAVACTQKHPLIGVSCSRYNDLTILPATYTDAITRSGGIPVILPTINSYSQAEELLSKLDGLVFSGGEDVNPAWYSESVLNESVEIDPIRDRSDSLLARAALSSGKPVLAICRGSQLMNVILGGSLYQDIPTQIPENIGHGGTDHKIATEPGSVLSRIYGPDSLTVRSSHHQCVKDVGKGITVTARSADGIVEAWETPQIWAVQFHPEKSLADGDDSWLALFSAYIQRVSKKLFKF